MNFQLLESDWAGLVYYIYGLIILFMLLAALLETVVMILMKYNIRFKKAFLDSLIVNVVTLAIGFLILKTALFNSYSVLNFFILYAITVAGEFPLLYLLNKKKPLLQTLKVVLLMNLVSYLLLIAIASI
jgi:hypothetical protein